MFKPFKQSGSDRSGLGLGLAICQQGVEANNGMLSVRDVPDFGCVFTIDLPDRRTLPSPTQGRRRDAVSGPTTRVSCGTANSLVSHPIVSRPIW